MSYVLQDVDWTRTKHVNMSLVVRTSAHSNKRGMQD